MGLSFYYVSNGLTKFQYVLLTTYNMYVYIYPTPHVSTLPNITTKTKLGLLDTKWHSSLPMTQQAKLNIKIT